MKNTSLALSSSLLVGSLLSGIAAAQSLGGSVGLSGEVSRAPQPLVSLWNDGAGFGLELEAVDPGGSGLVGELVLGVDVVPGGAGGASATVVPLVRVPVLMGPPAGGSASASLRLPSALVVAAMDFYAQGVVRGSAGLVGMSEPFPIGFEGVEAMPVCPKEDEPQQPAQAGSGGVGWIGSLAGLPVGELVERFAGENGLEAQAAYRELFRRGSAAIGPVLALAAEPASAVAPWPSDQTFEARSASFVRFEGGAPVTLRRMSLYLVSAIATGLVEPYAVNELADETFSDAPASELEEIALAHVELWWAANAGRTLAELRAEPRPLAGAPVDFGVPQGVLDPSLVFPQNVGLEDFAPGSETPLALGAAHVQARGGDQTFLSEEEEEKKDPYNCLSWAVHCDMCHGWVQPCKPSGAAIDGWMMMNGWSTTPPAGGASQTASIQKHVDGSGRETWVHAMKKNADCSWSSKNGAGPFYPSFPDPVCFGNMHYPPPTGSTSSFQNWYK